MTWQYTIEWHSIVGSSNRKSIVVVNSKPRSQMEKTLITLQTWTSSLPKSLNNGTQMDHHHHVVLYAQVLRGDSPVIGARVMASVTLESTNNGSVVTLSPVRLHDNGYGGEQKKEPFLHSIYLG
jgi:hypothetical protein